MFKKVIGWFKALFTKENAKKLAKEVKKTMVATTSAAVNARIGRFRALGPWVLLALVVIVGCAVTQTCYVREQDKVTALRPGEIYSNATESVEWIVPRAIMTQLVIAEEKL